MTHPVSEPLLPCYRLIPCYRFANTPQTNRTIQIHHTAKTMYQLLREQPKFILAIIIANVLLSAWSITLDSVINNDGVTYLAMAELFLQGDWETAKSYYSWPFYPLLIAGIAKALFLDASTAAYALNTLLAMSLSLAFVAVVGELSNNNRRILLIAAVVILLFPSITKYRAYIIRDFGYLSFYLWSLYFIFRFCATLSKKHLIGWLSATGLACLFRFEGIILLFVAPYFLFLFSTGRIQHRKKILASLSVSIVVASTAIISWYLNDKYQANIQLAQEAGKDIQSVFDLFMANINEQFGTASGGAWAYLSPIGSKVLDVVYQLIRRMAVFYFFLGLIAYWLGMGLSTRLHKRIWLVYLLTNLLMLIGFSFTNNLVVGRYTMATALTILLLAPFAIDRVINALKSNKLLAKIGAALLLFVLTYASADGLNVKTKKAHFIEVGRWLHNNLPEGASLFSNDRLVVHYADLGPKSNFVDQFTNKQMWSHIDKNVFYAYDYVAVSVTPNSLLESNFASSLWYKMDRGPIKVFDVNNGRKVIIFSTQPQDKHPSAVKSTDEQF